MANCPNCGVAVDGRATVCQNFDSVGLALFGTGSVLLLVAAGLLFTGNPQLVGYGVPFGLLGIVATILGSRRFDD